MYFGNNDNASLFLEQLTDDADNGLTIFICKSIKIKASTESVKAAADGNAALLKVLEDSEEVVPDPEQLYRIHFDNYLMYQTKNESYTSYDPYEIRRGKGLVLLSKSRLLDSLDTFIIADLIGADYTHYGIHTCDHIIDVISNREPTIELISREDYDIPV
jgi:hypothetical protein